MPDKSQANPNTGPEPTGYEDSSFKDVRALASAEYFDDWSGQGAWPIVIANRAVGDLRRIRKRDGHVFKMVGKKIKELSQGFFSDDNQKRLTGSNTEVPIYEAKVSRDLRIVYQIDLDTDIRTKVYKQVIKIYGIYTHAQMDNRLWSLVSNYHTVHRGKEYRRRCLFRETPRTLGNNVTLPGQFSYEESTEVPIENQSDATGLAGSEIKAEELSKVRSIVASEKFMLMSKSLVQSLMDDVDRGHVFQVSPKEKEVIYYDSACFVLGRSGTGKTTCIVFKMLGIEKAYEWAEEEKPRQVFVTQSPELAQRVQEYYRGLVEADFNRATRPNQSDTNAEPILADLRDEDLESFGLPSRYSLLEDKHFPLFLTFDQLCSLLEEDYKFEFGDLAHLQASTRLFNPQFSVEIENETKANQLYINDKVLPAVIAMEKSKENKHSAVTFDVFARAYWPHFDQRLTKCLDPALVYSEFLGVIEGSEFALTSGSGVISRNDYLNLNQGNKLLSSQREEIYNLYESYRKARGRLGGYDAAERTHALIVATQGGKRVPGQKIDALYVDEAQDNLLIDTKLLRNLSNNPHGILMAGDTAQTISAGSSFRFEDLKAFSWRLENQDEDVRVKKRKPIHPTLFHLSVNYRSHSGIVDCASALVELVSELFPNSIDALQRETGLIEGPRPTFFSGWESSSVPIDRFLRNQDNVKIDFGANQVILVRNDAARNALRAQVGDIGLVLTLYESKGLEFNDVLLYNFFEDSIATATTWRIVLHALDNSKHRLLPQFEEVRHAVICTELKNLYVGLTRARNFCWILDVSERAEPMKEFWSKRKLIEHCGVGDPIPQLSASSTKSEWEAQGRALFERRLYPQAILCFERAGLTLERDISAAYEARKQARLIQATKSDDRASCVAFCTAADKFLQCSKIAISKQQLSCQLCAADCFVQAEEWKLAAEAFVLAREFGLAAKNFRYAGCFDQAIDIIKTHREDIQESVVAEIIKVTRLQYLRTNKYEEAEEFFEDLDEQLDYMEDCGLDSGRIHVLEQHQRHEEAIEAAAAAALDTGDIIKGVRLLYSSNEPKLVRRAAEKALEGLWLLFPLTCQVDLVENPAAEALIQHIDSNLEVLTKEEAHELEIFQAIHTKNQDRIRSLAQSHGILASDSPYRSTLSLLCFARSSDVFVPLEKWSLQQFINTTRLSCNYVTRLFDFARNIRMSDLPTQRLLGIEPAEHTSISTGPSKERIVSQGFRIYSTSPLYKYLPPPETPDQGASIFSNVLNVEFRTVAEPDSQTLALNAVWSILRSEIYKIHSAASAFTFQILYPCLDFAVFGSCKRTSCTRQHFGTVRTSEAERQVLFNLRTQALIVQINLADKYYAQTRSDEAERRKIRRTWVHKLYETLMPLFPPLGSIYRVDSSLIRELNKGAQSISVWCHQALFELDPRYGAEDRFLSDVLGFLDLAFRIDGIRFSQYAGALHSSRLVKSRQDLMTSKPRFPSDRASHSILHDFVNFYRRKSDDVIQRAIYAIEHVVINRLIVEANLLVHLMEFVGREIIILHRTCHRGKYGVFDDLIVPRSWALDMAKRPPLPSQQGIRLVDLNSYLNTLYKTLENLRNYVPKPPRELLDQQQSKDASPSVLYSFSGKGSLNLLGRGILILRICRLILLVADSTGFTSQMKESARNSISSALTGPGEINRFLCDELIQANSWSRLQNIITRCPLNRSTDRLTHLSLRDSTKRPQPRSSTFVDVVTYKNVPELVKLLSFTGSTQVQQQSQPTLNPQAQMFDPSRPNQSSSVGQASALGSGNDPDLELEGVSDLIHSDPESSHFDALPESQSGPMSARILTAKENESGRKILFVYRQYILQKQARQRSAVNKIWRCFARYIRRRNAPRSAADDQYFRFQRDYIKDVKVLEESEPGTKIFYRHKAILLGCMPHVAACIRAIEHVNRLQKHANRKRLPEAHHRELEDIQRRMDACSEFTIQLKRLMLAIMPGSVDLQELTILQEHVKEVERIYREMGKVFGVDVIPGLLEEHRRHGVAPILACSL